MLNRLSQKVNLEEDYKMIRYFAFKTTLLVTMTFISTTISFAQTGGISGKVTDKSNGEDLAWANIIITGTSLGTSTDLDGNYIIRNVPVGKYTVKVSYIGYAEEVAEIVVVENRRTETNFELQYGDAIEGEEVIITAQASGELQAINQQLSSNTITNIVDESKIKELPDANAAESVGRLPGVAIQRSGGEATKVTVRGLSPKYNAVTINGVEVPATGANDRSVDLSLISSNMLSGIEVIKAALPDRDANSFGGTIDLKLGEAKPGGSFSVSLQGGYSQYRDIYGNYDFDISYSNRFFNDKFGVIASVQSEEYDRSADKFSGNYVPDGK